MKIFIFLLFISQLGFAQQIISIHPVAGWTEHDCNGTEINENTPAPQYIFNAYKVIYSTVDVAGNPTKASGLVAYRSNFQKKPYLTAIHHGIQLSQRGGPSEAGYKIKKDICLLKDLNSYFLLPDFLGIGESKMFHPFLHAKTEASAAEDFIRAFAAYLDQQNSDYRRELVIAGYSQGGHVTVALQRKIENQTNFPLELKLSIPMAGPYSISGLGVDAILNKDYSKVTSYYALYVITAMHKYYNVFPNDDYPIRSEFQDALDSVLARSSMLTFWHAASRPSLMFRDEFIAELRQRQPTLLYQALLENDLHQVQLQTETHIIAAKGDSSVDPEHSILLYQNQNNAQHVHLILLGEELGHASGKNPSIAKAVELVHAKME